VIHLILLAVAALLPVIILTLLRVDAAVAYLSLCLGYVLVQFVGNDTVSLVTAFSPHVSSVSENDIKIVFLWLPVILTMIVMFHSVSGPKTLLNIAPALGVGLLGVLLVEPLLSPSIQNSLIRTSLWKNFLMAQTLIVGLSAILALSFLWIGHRTGGHHEKHRKHSKG
jgi:hypothetical protein